MTGGPPRAGLILLAAALTSTWPAGCQGQNPALPWTKVRVKRVDDYTLERGYTFLRVVARVVAPNEENGPQTADFFVQGYRWMGEPGGEFSSAPSTPPLAGSITAISQRGTITKLKDGEFRWQNPGGKLANVRFTVGFKGEFGPEFAHRDVSIQIDAQGRMDVESDQVE